MPLPERPVEIRLWSVVAEADALTLAGEDTELHLGPAAVLAAGRDTVVVVADGAVRTAEDLAVAGPFPAHVATLLTAAKPPAVLAFARLPEGCMALGSARVARLGRRRGALQDLDLVLDAPLPYDLLDRVRPTGPPPQQPGVGWLDLLPGDPSAALNEFIGGWYADVPPRDLPEPPDGQPEPLRAFHRAAAGRSQVYGTGLHIYPEPVDAAGALAFGQEGDGVFTLLTDTTPGDPPVYYRGLGDQPLRERERLRAYLLLAALSTAAMDTSPGGMAFTDRAQMKRMIAPLRRVPLRPARWPCARSRFYVGPGIVILVGAADDGDWYEVYVGARHRSLLRRFRKLGLDWERFDG
ncbi:hypothetical protein [Actinoplanes aureus]|uniref:Uncharacterized protein n=1 Tax=Actinoplanes aureus TaxID=2792083 RepID=A0A931G0U8_9ACTN|nr:hypothetical protein [Actinoplanes aureus]MBG0566295.1 hypothetical protein [Actinoplanes aureus]